MGTDSQLQRLAGDDDDADDVHDDDDDDDGDDDGDDEEDDEITVEAYRATCASHGPAMRTSMMSAGGLIKKKPTYTKPMLKTDANIVMTRSTHRNQPLLDASRSRTLPGSEAFLVV